MKFIAKPGKSLPASPVIILGIPSHGNLGQMAVDCLLSTLAGSLSVKGDEQRLEQLGSLQSEHVSAITGYEELCEGWGRTLCMPIEVYGVVGTDFVLVLQRAPCVSSPPAEQSFARDLACFLLSPRSDCCSAGARRVLVLCGANLQAVQDDDMLRSNRFFDLQSPAACLQFGTDFPAFPAALSAVDHHLAWTALQQLRQASAASSLPVPPRTELYCDDYDVSALMAGAGAGEEEGGGGAFGERVGDLVPGCSLVGWLLLELLEQDHRQQQGLGQGEGAVCVLGKYCNEGNNVQEALALAVLAATALGLDLVGASGGGGSGAGVRVSMPKSWASLLGPPLSLSSASMF